MRMNFLSLVSPEEAVGGLIITDSDIQLLDQKKISRADLEKGTITGGIIANSGAFERSLRKLLDKEGTRLRYFVVSIPTHPTYLKRFSFPATLHPDRLAETVDLTLSFQLPFATEKIYSDYETVRTDSHFEVYFAACLRSTVESYMRACGNVGIKPIAIEPHTVSLARSLPASTVPRLLILPYGDGSCVAVIEHGLVVFSRFLPTEHVSDKKTFEAEVQKIKMYYEAEYGVAPQEEALSPADTYLAAGVRQRMALKKSEDNHLSLLPVGTEQAYEYQKAAAFSSFVRNLSIGLALFFITTYLGAWGLVARIERTVIERSISSPQTSSVDTAQKEEKIKRFNEFISMAGELVKTSPSYSVIVKNLTGSITDGIVVSSLTFGSPEAKVNLTGIAKTRTQLVGFKKNLDATDFFSGVALPLTELERKEDIPFTISMDVARKEDLYPH